MYNLSFLTVVLDYLLPALRNAFHMAWVRVLITPLEELKETFMIWKEDVDVLANTTFQVISIEKILNDRFNIPNPVQMIYIKDVMDMITPTFLFFNAETQTEAYLYFDSEHQPATYLYFEEEFSFSTDFIVYVPAAVYNAMVADGSINAMKKLINIYKMAGKIYQIIPY